MAILQYVLQASKQYPWEAAGSITTTQAALTTAKDSVTVNALAAAVKVIINPVDLQVATELRFITDDDADANVLNLYAMAGDTDFYKLIATITLTGGTTVAPGTSKVFCDTLVLTAEKWPTSMKAMSPIANDIAGISLNVHGYKNFLLIATTLANTLTVQKRRL